MNTTLPVILMLAGIPTLYGVEADAKILFFTKFGR